MDPLEALQLLENVSGTINGNRETHVKIMEALKIIGSELMARRTAKSPDSVIGLK